jgi:hypothetical protein
LGSLFGNLHAVSTPYTWNLHAILRGFMVYCECRMQVPGILGRLDHAVPRRSVRVSKDLMVLGRVA